MTVLKPGSCYDFSGVEPTQKGHNPSKGTPELVLLSTFRAVPVDTFALEPAHCVHSVKEVMQHESWQPYYTITGVVTHHEEGPKGNVKATIHDGVTEAEVMFWVDTSLELVKIVRDLRTNDPPVMCCRPLQVKKDSIHGPASSSESYAYEVDPVGIYQKHVDVAWRAPVAAAVEGASSIPITVEGKFEAQTNRFHGRHDAGLPLLQSAHSKTIVNISCGSGSLSGCYEEFVKRRENTSKHLPACLGYKTSKAALKLLTLTWASDVTPEEGFTFAAIHPGMVATDMSTTGWRTMGFDEAMLALQSTPTQAVEQLLGTIAKLNLQDSGWHLNVDGTPYAF